VRSVLCAVALAVAAGLLSACGASEQGSPQQGARHTIRVKGNFTIDDARTFRGFPLYYVGQSAAGLPLVAIHRSVGEGHGATSFSVDKVTFLYGTCEAPVGSGCMPPIQVQIWNACKRSGGIYGIPQDEALNVRGVPAAFYEGRTRLELYTPQSTIVLLGRNETQLLELANALRGIDGRNRVGPLPATGGASQQSPCAS
jgi:hypothetical protein